MPNDSRRKPGSATLLRLELLDPSVNGSEARSVFPLEGGLSTTIAVGLAIALVVEGAVIHLWVAERSALWAWIITATNVATLVYLWREVRASALSRLVVAGGDAEIIVGRRLRCQFSRSQIASAEVATWRSVPDAASDFVNTAKPLEPNVVLVMRELVEARMPLGMVRRVGRFGLRVADPELVVRELLAAR
jgi:hypothetical protein